MAFSHVTATLSPELLFKTDIRELLNTIESNTGVKPTYRKGKYQIESDYETFKECEKIINEFLLKSNEEVSSNSSDEDREDTIVQSSTGARPSKYTGFSQNSHSAQKIKIEPKSTPHSNYVHGISQHKNDKKCSFDARTNPGLNIEEDSYTEQDHSNTAMAGQVLERHLSSGDSMPPLEQVDSEEIETLRKMREDSEHYYKEQYETNSADDSELRNENHEKAGFNSNDYGTFSVQAARNPNKKPSLGIGFDTEATEVKQRTERFGSNSTSTTRSRQNDDAFETRDVVYRQDIKTEFVKDSDVYTEDIYLDSDAWDYTTIIFKADVNDIEESYGVMFESRTSGENLEFQHIVVRGNSKKNLTRAVEAINNLCGNISQSCYKNSYTVPHYVDVQEAKSVLSQIKSDFTDLLIKKDPIEGCLLFIGETERTRKAVATFKRKLNIPTKAGSNRATWGEHPRARSQRTPPRRSRDKDDKSPVFMPALEDGLDLYKESPGRSNDGDTNTLGGAEWAPLIEFSKPKRLERQDSDPFAIEPSTSQTDHEIEELPEDELAQASGETLPESFKSEQSSSFDKLSLQIQSQLQQNASVLQRTRTAEPNRNLKLKKNNGPYEKNEDTDLTERVKESDLYRDSETTLLDTAASTDNVIGERKNVIDDQATRRKTPEFLPEETNAENIFTRSRTNQAMARSDDDLDDSISPYQRAKMSSLSTKDDLFGDVHDFSKRNIDVPHDENKFLEDETESNRVKETDKIDKGDENDNDLQTAIDLSLRGPDELEATENRELVDDEADLERVLKMSLREYEAEQQASLSFYGGPSHSAAKQTVDVSHNHATNFNTRNTDRQYDESETSMEASNQYRGRNVNTSIDIDFDSDEEYARSLKQSFKDRKRSGHQRQEWTSHSEQTGRFSPEVVEHTGSFADTTPEETKDLSEPSHERESVELKIDTQENMAEKSETVEIDENERIVESSEKDSSKLNLFERKDEKAIQNVHYENIPSAVEMLMENEEIRQEIETTNEAQPVDLPTRTDFALPSGDILSEKENNIFERDCEDLYENTEKVGETGGILQEFLENTPSIEQLGPEIGKSSSVENITETETQNADNNNSLSGNFHFYQEHIKSLPAMKNQSFEIKLLYQLLDTEEVSPDTEKMIEKLLNDSTASDPLLEYEEMVSVVSGGDHKTPRNDKKRFGNDQTTLENDQTTLENDQTTLENDQTTLENDQTTLENDQTTLENDQTTLENDQATLGNDQATLKNDQTTLGNDQTALGNDQTTLGYDQTTLGYDQTTLGYDKTTLGNDHKTSDPKTLENDAKTQKRALPVQTRETCKQKELPSAPRANSTSTAIPVLVNSIEDEHTTAKFTDSFITLDQSDMDYLCQDKNEIGSAETSNDKESETPSIKRAKTNTDTKSPITIQNNCEPIFQEENMSSRGGANEAIQSHVVRLFSDEQEEIVSDKYKTPDSQTNGNGPNLSQTKHRSEQSHSEDEMILSHEKYPTTNEEDKTDPFSRDETKLSNGMDKLLEQFSQENDMTKSWTYGNGTMLRNKRNIFDDSQEPREPHEPQANHTNSNENKWERLAEPNCDQSGPKSWAAGEDETKLKTVPFTLPELPPIVYQPEGGNMTTLVDQHYKLPGFTSGGTIMYTFDFAHGRMKMDGPYPNQEYQGTYFKTYLPINRDGNEVGELIKEAFEKRKLFTIKKSEDIYKTNIMVPCVPLISDRRKFPNATYLPILRGTLQKLLQKDLELLDE